MSDANDPRMRPAHRDRGARLVVFGALASVCGLGAIGLGLLHLLLPWIGRSLGAPAGGGGGRNAAMGFLVYGLLGAALIWAGIGSMRKRRWVRPIMLMLAWTWLMAGVLGALLIVALSDELIAVAAAEAGSLPYEIELTIKLVLVGASIGGGVILPAIFVWAYQGRDVAATCAAHDRGPAWTDRCPSRVLGLSAALGLAALLCLPLALRPVVPLFGMLVTGWPAAAIILAGGGLCAWLAVSTYRLEPRGWWVTTVLPIVLGLSVVVTFMRVDPLDPYRALGYPDEQLDLMQSSAATFANLTVWTTIVLTLVSVVYMLAVRTHFRIAAPTDEASR